MKFLRLIKLRYSVVKFSNKSVITIFLLKGVSTLNEV